ncbi:predicted protein [Thalassiosira pseudonana CCMP1335]|uniref:Uncharacterized protein n=1 Tax=Thalassiosira pseudonana TaxID=35128 RepID=B5YP53_THAPS|nr:predicted protein [Thalassiosira pseudonana CCMP1335]ACI64397.1 predicted protein [Thalassiosira pseudonana CCMP1335]
MDETLVLLPTNMNFNNPFRSYSSSSRDDNHPTQQRPPQQTQQQTHSSAATTIDDSWHSNMAQGAHLPMSASVDPPPMSSSTPLSSWFASWTSAASAGTSTATVNASTAATTVVPAEAANKRAAVDASQRVSTTVSTAEMAASMASPPPSSPSALNMIRGIDSHEEEDQHHHRQQHHLQRNNKKGAMQTNNQSKGGMGGEEQQHIYATHHALNNNISQNDSIKQQRGDKTKSSRSTLPSIMGGCIPSGISGSISTLSTIHKVHETSGVGGHHHDIYSIIHDVPFEEPPPPPPPPPSRQTKQQQTREHSQMKTSGEEYYHYHHESVTSYGEEVLLVNFRDKSSSRVTRSKDKTRETVGIQNDSILQTTPATTIPTTPPPVIEEEHTFPGFALFTMAQVYYKLGKYSKALDTTTECLAFQKKVLKMNGVGSVGVTDVGGGAHAIPSTVASTTAAALTMSSSSIFNTSVGNSVRNLLKGTSPSIAASPDTFDNLHNMQSLPHPTPAANLTTYYPTHACVAHTLLLRGRVLAACGLYGSDEDNGDPAEHNNNNAECDFSLLHQAMRHVEMAIAIQRILSSSSNVNGDLTHWELATPIVLLGVLRTYLGNFEEANLSFEEALLILRSVRQIHEEGQASALQRKDDAVASRHAVSLKRTTSEIAHITYLRGRSYHCRRMYTDAFGCYNRSLNLFLSVGTPKYDSATRRIIRCMKKRCAFEKLVSAYLDDPFGI